MSTVLDLMHAGTDFLCTIVMFFGAQKDAQSVVLRQQGELDRLRQSERKRMFAEQELSTVQEVGSSFFPSFLPSFLPFSRLSTNSTSARYFVLMIISCDRGMGGFMFGLVWFFFFCFFCLLLLCV
jgi:hypothetical protein